MGLSKYHSATTESILRVSNATVASVQVYISRKFPLFASKSSFGSQAPASLLPAEDIDCTVC